MNFKVVEFKKVMDKLIIDSINTQGEFMKYKIRLKKLFRV